MVYSLQKFPLQFPFCRKGSFYDARILMAATFSTEPLISLTLNRSISKKIKKMVNIRKSLSLVISLFVLLSNVAFAQYSDPSQYEGRPIDPSREGIDYYREGDVIVYPSNSGPGSMDDRYRNMNEDEMRRL